MPLPKIAPPTILEELDYEAIVARKLARIKEILTQKGIAYEPSEADDLMTLIEMDAYEEMLLRTQLNARIKQQFLLYATGSNLDHIGITRFGVARLEGIKPRASMEFRLSKEQESDIVLPKGLLLGNGTETAHLIDDLIIKAGQTSAVGVIELDRETQSSDVKTQLILTPLPWLIKARQLSSFTGGADPENDERYRERLWLSRERRTTAGSRLMYEFYAKSADVRIKEVNVASTEPGVVHICYHADEDVTHKLLAFLNAEEIRPLTDKIEVQKARVRQVTIDATLAARDVHLVDIQAIKRRFRTFEERFNIFVSIPKIYDLLTDENIIDVELRSPFSTIETEFDEVVRFDLRLEVRHAA